MNALDWESRTQTATRAQAMATLAQQLAYFLDPRGYTPVDIDELQEYATKWSLPYSAELFRQLKNNINAEFDGWDSSSMQC